MADILKRADAEPAMVVVPEAEREAMFQHLFSFISEQSGYSKRELTGPGRRRELVKHRRMLVYLAVKHLGWTPTAAGRKLNLSAPSALTAMSQGEQQLAG